MLSNLLSRRQIEQAVNLFPQTINISILKELRTVGCGLQLSPSGHVSGHDHTIESLRR
jgi:hypothetical protein